MARRTRTSGGFSQAQLDKSVVCSIASPFLQGSAPFMPKLLWFGLRSACTSGPAPAPAASSAVPPKPTWRFSGLQAGSDPTRLGCHPPGIYALHLWLETDPHPWCRPAAPELATRGCSTQRLGTVHPGGYTSPEVEAMAGMSQALPANPRERLSNQGPQPLNGTTRPPGAGEAKVDRPRPRKTCTRSNRSS